MATVRQVIPAASFLPTGNETFPGFFEAIPGSAIPRARGLAFDAAAIESVQFPVDASRYGSGDLTVRVWWYADTANSGDVRWGASVCAQTPDGGDGDIEADTWDTEATVDDSHLGTTGQRLHYAELTVSSLDGLAARDFLSMRLRRIGNHANDTMTGDAIVVAVEVSFSDT